MNDRQRRIIWLTVGGLLAAGIYAPWTTQYRTGYAPIFQGHGHVDMGRLGIEWFLIALLGTALALLPFRVPTLRWPHRIFNWIFIAAAAGWITWSCLEPVRYRDQRVGDIVKGINEAEAVCDSLRIQQQECNEAGRLLDLFVRVSGENPYQAFGWISLAELCFVPPILAYSLVLLAGQALRRRELFSSSHDAEEMQKRLERVLKYERE
jgi:hypothetical protein